MEEERIDFRGALINEQGITFAVVEVEPGLLDAGEDAIKAERTRYEPIFRNKPIILASRGTDGRARYSGRPDIVRFLVSSGWSRIPWKRYRARRKDRNPFREWG